MSLIAGEVYAETDLTDYENIILNLQKRADDYAETGGENHFP